MALILICCWAAAPAPARARGWIDRVQGMAVDTAGNVYVTGNSQSQEVQWLIILKYDADGQLLWEQREPFGEGKAVAVDAAGNVYVAGQAASDFVTIKFGPDGSRTWLKRYDGPGHGSDTAVAIAVDAWGNVFVSGSSPGKSSGLDYATIKYNSEGTRLWVQRYNGQANSSDIPVALAVDDAGNVYVTGDSWGGDTREDYATIKYSPDGERLWIRRYGSEWPVLSSTEHARAIAVSGQYVYVTGISYSWPLPGAKLGGNFDTVKYRASSGQTVWTRRYNGPVNGDDDPAAMAVDQDGNIYVTGSSPGDGTSSDYATVKYSPGGIERWVARYNGPGNLGDKPKAIAVDAQGYIYVTGSSWGNGTYMDYATVKYHPDGAEQWARRFNGPANASDDGMAIGLDGERNVVVAGVSYGGYTSDDMAIIKYTTNGDAVWTRRYTGLETQGDVAVGLTVDSQDHIYVTGYSYREGTAQDYATVAYSAGGNQLWVQRYDGAVKGPDEPVGIGADGLGNLYVTGTSMGSSTYNYLTVKYRAADGKKLWSRRYHRKDSLMEMPWALAVDAQGNVAVTGSAYSNFTTKLDYATVLYNSDGDQVWARIFSGSAKKYDQAYAVALDTLGNVFVTGLTETENRQADFLTIKYGLSGDRVWTRYYDADKDWDTAMAVATDAQGNIYVTGSSIKNNLDGMATIKYLPGGEQEWVRRCAAKDRVYNPKAIAVDAQGNVYVAGTAYALVNSNSSNDYFVVKYNAAGIKLWMQGYNGPGQGADQATALVVDDAGNVYVTGQSQGADGFSDYATIKFNSDGLQLWVSRYNGPGKGHDGAVGLALSSNQKYVYVTGTSYGGLATGDDYATIKYRASDGLRLWVQRSHGANP